MSQFFQEWCQENLAPQKIELEMQNLNSKLHQHQDDHNNHFPKHSSHAIPELKLTERLPTSNFLEPNQIYNKLVYNGEKKSRAGRNPSMWWMILWQGILAGIYIGLGDVLLLTVGAQSYHVKHENPGIYKMLLGAFGLPFGLTLVVLTGAELFTSNTCYLAAAFYEGRASLWGLMGNWVFSYAGNFLGALLLCIWVKGCDLFHDHLDAVQGVALYKSGNDFGVVLLRGILCNWCVNLAVWQATSAQDVAGKFVGIFLPISAFVAIGFEHSVANMFLIPFGMMNGADISVGRFLGNNLIPATLGNIIAGSLCMAGSYGMLYGSLSHTILHCFSPTEENKLKRQKSRQRSQELPKIQNSNKSFKNVDIEALTNDS